MVTRAKTNPRQIDGSSAYLSRSPFIHPAHTRPNFLDTHRWRIIASEPINRMARRMIQREISSLNFRIAPIDAKSSQQKEAAEWYTEVWKDFRNLTTRSLKTLCELPQGGAWEVGWIKPGLYGEGDKGTLSFVKYIDAGTLHPTVHPVFPIMQVDPINTLITQPFRDEEIVRILGWPYDRFGLEWWQESPTEASFLAIEALSRIYTFSLKQLKDTPVAGILDMMDFSEKDAVAWAEGFREMLIGIDPVKIPILYEHEKPAKFLPLGNDFSDLEIPRQFNMYVDMVLSNYGLSINDLRIFNQDNTKTGSAVSRKITLMQGISFFAEIIKDAVQSTLPPYLIFTYTEPDLEDERTRAQIRAANARTIQTLDWLPVADKARQAVEDGVLTIDIDPEEIAKKAEAVGVGMGGVQKPTPGQLTEGEGRTVDDLENDAKRTATTGSKVFTKSLVDRIKDEITASIDKAVATFKVATAPRTAKFPVTGSKFGIKTERAAKLLATALQKQFMAAGKRTTTKIIAKLVTDAQTQVPDLLTETIQDPMQAKSNGIDHYLEEKADDGVRNRIRLLLEETLLLEDFYEIDDDDAFLDIIFEILQLAYEDGLLAVAEMTQINLASRGVVTSPIVNLAFNVVDSTVIKFLKSLAANMVRNVNEGTKFFLRSMITEGALQNLGVDEITDRIQQDLFGLPADEAGQLSRDRIRSIVTTELNRADTFGRLKQMKEIGLKLKKWLTRIEDVCNLCLANEAFGSVKLTFQYDDVFGKTLGPPGHPRTCHCSLGADIGELETFDTQPDYWTGGKTEKADLISPDDLIFPDDGIGPYSVNIVPNGSDSFGTPIHDTEKADLIFPDGGIDSDLAELLDAQGMQLVYEYEEKFNPYHVPAGSPPGGQFTTSERGIFSSTGQKVKEGKVFEKEQARITKEIDAISKVYAKAYKAYFRSEDAAESAKLWGDLDDMDKVRNVLIKQREQNKSILVELAVRSIVNDNPALGRKLKAALQKV